MITFKNTATLLGCISDLIRQIGDNKDYFTLSQGIFETNIVVSKNLEEHVNSIFQKETAFGRNPLLLR